MTETMIFSSKDAPLSPLANGFPIYLDGQNWKSCEHYYQYQKFKGIDDNYSLRIKNANTPFLAQLLGNSSLIAYDRNSWNKIKYAVMYRAQMAKFLQNKNARNYLIKTEPNILIYYSSDPYWGNFKDGTGSNYLGIILMKIRKKCQKELK